MITPYEELDSDCDFVVADTATLRGIDGLGAVHVEALSRREASAA